MNEGFDQQKIEDYLRGQLSAKEEAHFRQEMQNDTALTQEVAQQKKELQAIAIYRETELRNSMEQWRAAPRQTGSRSLMKWVLIIVGLIIIALLGYWLYNLADQPSPESIQIAYYQAPAVGVSRQMMATGNTTTKSIDTLLQTALNAYDQEQFAEAIGTLTEILTLDSTVTAAKLFLAHSYFQNGAFQEAIPLFRMLEDSENLSNFQRDQALLSRIIAYVQIGQLREANELLEKALNDPNFDFQRTGRALLKDIERM